MNHSRIPDPRILELLEACRPGHDDLADPAMAPLAAELAAHSELASLRDRLEEVDGAIGQAMHDVDVPEGLAERLLAGLGERPAAKVEEEAADSPTVAPAPVAGRRLSRRRMLAGTAALATTASLLVAVGIWWFGDPPVEYTKDMVLRDAIDFFQHDTSGGGQLLAEVAPPEEFRFSREVLPLEGTRWRRIEGFLGCKGVAYDLTYRGTQATLYVVKQTVADLGRYPPNRPMQDTLGYPVAAWNSMDGRLYVLVVASENAADYRYFTKPPGPLT